MLYLMYYVWNARLHFLSVTWWSSFQITITISDFILNTFLKKKKTYKSHFEYKLNNIFVKKYLLVHILKIIL